MSLCFIGCYLPTHGKNKYQLQKLPHTFIIHGPFEATDPGHYNATEIGHDLDLQNLHR